MHRQRITVVYFRDAHLGFHELCGKFEHFRSARLFSAQKKLLRQSKYAHSTKREDSQTSHEQNPVEASPPVRLDGATGFPDESFVLVSCLASLFGSEEDFALWNEQSEAGGKERQASSKPEERSPIVRIFNQGQIDGSGNPERHFRKS